MARGGRHRGHHGRIGEQAHSKRLLLVEQRRNYAALGRLCRFFCADLLPVEWAGIRPLVAKMPNTPNRFQRTQIAVAAMVDERTVAHAYAGRAIRYCNATRIVDAARRLGFALPPCANEVPTPPTDRAA